jgi:hypothetical protein
LCWDGGIFNIYIFDLFRSKVSDIRTNSWNFETDEVSPMGFVFDFKIYIFDQLSLCFLVAVVGHVVSVYFIPYVSSLFNLINTAFDWKNYTATAVGSVSVLVTIVVSTLAWWRAKPYKKYRLPWNIWKSLHYLLYVGFFAIAAHVIEAAKGFVISN